MKPETKSFEIIEQAMTVVRADDIRGSKYLPSSDFAGFSREHAGMLSAKVLNGPEYCAVPLAVHRWAVDNADAPSDPRKAWAAWREQYDAG